MQTPLCLDDRACLVRFAGPSVRYSVVNIHTGVPEEVPQCDVDVSGLRCGSGSNMNNVRCSCTAKNIEKHSTGQDVCTYCSNLDGRVPHKLGFVDNTTGTLEDRDADNESDEELSIGAEWRIQMNFRGFNPLSRTVLADRHGGPEFRKRFYEMNASSSAELGALQNRIT